MPWKVGTVMSQREEFVVLAQSEGVNMSELCLRSGISRKTGYKWLRRWLEGGERSLEDLPKRPHNSPNHTSAEMEQMVIDLRRSSPPKEDTCWPGCSRTEGTAVCRPRAPSRPSSGDMDL